jgi:hypothetical protein
MAQVVRARPLTIKVRFPSQSKNEDIGKKKWIYGNTAERSGQAGGVSS